MRYLHIIVACLVGTTVLFWATEDFAQESTTPSWQSQLEQLNDEIRELEDMRDRALAAAARAENDGMRWQFMQDQKQEAKRAFEKADFKREEALEIQAEIDRLKARRALLLKQHPEVDVAPLSPSESS